MSAPVDALELAERAALLPRGATESPPAASAGAAAAGGSLDHGTAGCDARAYVLRSSRSAPQSARTLNLREVADKEREAREGVGFHDWTEDHRWAAVGQLREQHGVRGALSRAWYSSQGWVAVGLIGVAVGTVGAMVNVACLWMHQLTRGVCGNGWWLPTIYCDPTNDGGQFRPWALQLGFAASPWADTIQVAIHILACCAMTLTAVWLTKTVAPQAAGAGVPEIKAILGGARLKGFGGVKTFLVKLAGIVLAIGGHLSVGKAAPTVHLGFGAASIIGSCFEKYRVSVTKRRELLTAGTAAGISVAFGAPLGGVLYALEETASYFGPQVLYRSFVCSAVAAITLEIWDPYLTRKLTLFSINYHSPWGLWEVPFFFLVGALGGVVGLLWSRANVFVLQVRQGFKRAGTYRPFLEAFLVTLFSVWLTTVLLPDGRTHTDAEYLRFLFRRCENGVGPSCIMTLEISVFLFIVKFVLTAVSFGMLLPGGLFMPNLVLGATLGWSVGSVLDSVVTSHRHNWAFLAQCDPQNDQFTGAACVVPSVYALVGAAAVMSGVTRLTISLVTIMFELTGGLEYIIPITVGVMTAKWVAEALGGRDSVYTQIMDAKGLEFLDPKSEAHAMDTTAASKLNATLAFDDDVAALFLLHQQQPLRRVVAALSRRREGLAAIGFPIVRSQDDLTVVGFISRRRLVIALSDLCQRLDEDGLVAEADAPVLLVDPERVFPRGQPQSGPAYVLHGYVDPAPLTVRESIDVARVVLVFRRLGLSAVLVVSEENKLRGWLSKNCVIQHLQGCKEGRGALLGSYCPGGWLDTELDAAPKLPHGTRLGSIADILPPLAGVLSPASPRPRK